MANTYTVKPCRFVPISDSQAVKHPDRVATILGIFYNEDGERLTGKSATGQIVTDANIDDPAYSFVPTTDAAGRILSAVLTMPGGERGRPKGESLRADDALAMLQARRDARALDALQDVAQTERAAELAAEAEAEAEAEAVTAASTLPVAVPSPKK